MPEGYDLRDMATATYRQIEAFKAVMDAGRVTDAANNLNLSQPAVSKLLANFEQALGMKLFIRDRKRLTATAEAHALLREINKIFVGVQDVTRFASELRNMRTGELTIVSVAALGQRHVPRVIAGFLRDHTSVNVGLHIRSSSEVADWTASQKADIGISMMPVDHPAVRDEILCEVDAVCVLPNGHHLGRKPFIEPRDLSGENFISFMRDGRLRHVIDSIFEQAQVSRQLRVDAFMSDSACAFVAADVGVSIVEPFTAAEYAMSKQLIIKPFRPPVLYQFRLLFPRFRAPSLVTQAFVEKLQTSIRTLRLPTPLERHGESWHAGISGPSRPRQRAPGRRRAPGSARG
jgi:DNA-binding transcriptional LysR family regulator